MQRCDVLVGTQLMCRFHVAGFPAEPCALRVFGSDWELTLRPIWLQSFRECKLTLGCFLCKVDILIAN